MGKRSNAQGTIKVFHVITRMIVGGAQENTLYTVEGLHRDGRFDVTLLTGPAVGPEGDLLERGNRAGVNIRVIKNLRRAIHPVRDLIVLYRLLKIFLKEKPDIVHTHSSKAGVLGRLAAKLAGIDIIIHTVHGLPFHPYQNRFINGIYIFLEKLCARFSDKIIVVANAMRDKCVAHNISTPDKFQRIFSGMEVDTFLNAPEFRGKMRKELGFDDQDIVVAKIARLFPLKGHRDLIKAASGLCTECNDLKFLLIGNGILRDELEREIRDAGLEDKFIFTGLISPSRIPAFLSAADMAVHTSYREGLARVLPQALLSGKPVVTYDIDGAPEVVNDEVNGKLVPCGDTQELEHAIKEVYANLGQYRKNVESAKEELAGMFSVEMMVKDIIFCYLTFIDN